MAHITLSNNKLLFSKEAAELLDVASGDRVDLRYWSENNTTTFPVIAKAGVFDESEGKKLTKKLTVSYRGLQATVLEEYGKEFNLVSFKEGVFKLVPVNEDENEAEGVLKEAEEALEKLETELIDW